MTEASVDVTAEPLEYGEYLMEHAAIYGPPIHLPIIINKR